MSVPTYAAAVIQKAGIPVTEKVPCKSETDFGKITLILSGQKFELENDDWMGPTEKDAGQISDNIGGSAGALTQQSKLKKGEVWCKSNIMKLDLAQ